MSDVNTALARFENLFIAAGVGQEDTMGKSNYGKCVLCGRTGNRDSGGMCYVSRCKDARQVPADPLEMRESPILDDDEVVALGEAIASPGQERSPESIKSYMRELGEMLDTADDVVVAGQDHIVDVARAVSDFAAPFSFGGFDFDPGLATPPPGRPIARLAPSGTLNFSCAATQAHDLKRFQYVQVIPDKTGSALALIFLAEKTSGARKLGAEGKAALKTSAEAVVRVAPGLVGKALELRSMGQDGALLAVVAGEAA
ncbi:hypothetical protein [Solidesulfovibrio sp.]